MICKLSLEIVDRHPTGTDTVNTNCSRIASAGGESLPFVSAFVVILCPRLRDLLADEAGEQARSRSPSTVINR
jgi:hypothetical protein